MLAYEPKTNPFEELKLLGLAIRGRTAQQGPYQSHIGILYRDKDDSPLMLLHFEAHASLKNEPPTSRYLWLQCVLDDVNKKIVASRCLQIYGRSRDKKIPYGISYDGTYFDSDGTYSRYRPGDGLTCATFVLAVFRWLGFEIVEASTWPPRPEDAGWQVYMVNDVMKTKWKQTPARIKAQNELIGQVARFRPEEVAIAAALYTAAPLKFAEVLPHVGELEEQLVQYASS